MDDKYNKKYIGLTKISDINKQYTLDVYTEKKE